MGFGFLVDIRKRIRQVGKESGYELRLPRGLCVWRVTERWAD